MKTTQRLFSATVLTILLTVSAFGGDMHTPGIGQPPPPQPPPNNGRAAETCVTRASGEIGGAHDLLTEVALFIYQKYLVTL